MLEYGLISTIFVFGLCIGSFLNVCIHRIPEDESIAYPPSRCPRCKTRIHFYDNIPVLSYIRLKGRCRECGEHISIRYPLVEILNGIAAVLVFLKFGLTIAGLVYFAFICTLVVISFIDIDHQIIPDVISLPGIPLCVLASLALPSMTFTQSVIGLLSGGGSLYLVAQVYYWLKKEEGMGGGDIKLLAMIGALIGWQGVLFTIFIGSAIGTLTGISMMIGMRSSDMKLRIPFGPFLSLAAVIYIFCGPALIRWYLNF